MLDTIIEVVCPHCGLEFIIGDSDDEYLTAEDTNQNNLTATERQMVALAEAGDNEAMLRLGFMYFLGEGVNPNYSNAMKWYKKAAEAGSWEAMNKVGSMYFFGKGVTQDFSMAKELHSRAAKARPID